MLWTLNNAVLHILMQKHIFIKIDRYYYVQYQDMKVVYISVRRGVIMFI